MYRQWISAACMGLMVHSAQADTLTDAIIRAIETGPDMQIVIEERYAKEEDIKQAYSQTLPTIGLEARFGPRRTGSPLTRHLYGGSRTISERAVSVQGRQMVYDGFQAQANIEKSIWETKAAAWMVKDRAAQVANAVAHAYIEVLKTQELTHLAQDTLVNYERWAGETRQKYRHRYVRHADLELVNSKMAMARKQVIKAESQFQEAQYRFKRLVGFLPDVEEMQLPLVQEDALPMSRPRAIAKALADHPALHSALSEIQASKAEVKSTKGALMPQVSLEMDLQEANNLNGLSGKTDSLGANLVVSYDLYDGGRVASRTRQAERKMHVEFEQRNLIKREVELEAAQAWNRYETLDKSLYEQESSLNSLRHARDQQLQDFRIGSVSMQSWLFSEDEFSNGEQRFIQLKYDALTEKYNVLYTVGDIISVLGLPLSDASEYHEKILRPFDFGFKAPELRWPELDWPDMSWVALKQVLMSPF